MKKPEELLEEAQKLNEQKEYQKVIDLLTDSKLELFKNADLYAEKAQAYYRLDEYELSLEASEKALLINLNHAKGNHYKGNYFYEKKEYEKAKEFYLRAKKANPKFAPSYNGLGLIYDEQKKYERAKKLFYKAIRLDPTYMYSYYNLGLTYSKLKEYEKAKIYFMKSLEIDEKNADAYYGIANIYYRQGIYQKAKEYDQKAIEANSGCTYAYYGLGLTYMVLKEYNNALTCFEKYAELTKSVPDYYTKYAESKIIDLIKLIDSEELGYINDLVNKTKNLLLFKNNSITHYTSLSVTKALLTEGILFRISEGAYLNDTSEGGELFKCLGVDFKLKNDSETIAELFARKPFIGSFVMDCKGDDLTLWRMYGKEAKEEAKGCAITLSINLLLENLRSKLTPENDSRISPTKDEEFNFYRVAYRQRGKSQRFIIPGATKSSENKLNKIMQEMIEKVRDYHLKKGTDPVSTKNLIEVLNDIAYLFKSSEYQHENEIRMVLSGVGFEKIIDIDTQPPRVYIELVGIRPLIKKITLGPKVEKADEWAAAFYYSLNTDGYQPEIYISHLPFK